MYLFFNCNDVLNKDELFVVCIDDDGNILGINFETGTKNNTHWEFRGEYLYFIYGQQTSYLSDLGYTDFTNDQEDGSGIKLTAKYYFDKKFGVEGYMDYWDIADSKLDVSGNFMEPRNTTSETGIRFFWSF